MEEFIVWGVPPDADPADALAETILYTKARTLADAKRVAALLERDHGCTKTRVQTLDLSAPAETVRAAFVASVRK